MAYTVLLNGFGERRFVFYSKGLIIPYREILSLNNFGLVCIQSGQLHGLSLE